MYNRIIIPVVFSLLYLSSGAQAACEGGWNISNVQLNGGGASVTVQPGGSVRLQYDYQVWNGTDCTGCRRQILAGLVKGGWSQVIDDCAYDSVPLVCPKRTSGSFDHTFNTPAGEGTYEVVAAMALQYKCADAKDKFPLQAHKQTIGTITVECTPKAFGPVPDDGATDVPPDTILFWDIHPRIPPKDFDVYLGTSMVDVGMRDPWVYKGQTSNRFHDPGGLAQSTTYYWAIDVVGSACRGSIWSFTTGRARATNPRPGDGQLLVGLDADLSWDAAPGAASHNVYFGTSSPPAFVANQAASTFDPGTLEPGTTYFWQINEVYRDMPDIIVVEGAVWRFTTVPGKATNPDPADGTESVPVDVELSWAPGPGCIVNWYRVHFGTSSPPPLIQTQTGKTYDPGTLEPGTTYYWQIDQECTLAGLIAGEVWEFTTIPPQKATNPDPADGETNVALDVTCTWDRGGGATAHNVYFGTDKQVVATADTETLGIYRGQYDVNYYEPPDLAPCTTYYWRVDELVPIIEAPPGTYDIYIGDVWEFKCIPCPEEFEFGDAPEGGIAYPSTGTFGFFPTCAAGVVRHGHSPNPLEGAWFGPGRDFELDGNAGWCPGCFPTYDDDECMGGVDAGLIRPHAYTIAGPAGAEKVVNCPGWGGSPLGFVCTRAKWGNEIDIWVENHLPNNQNAFVNVLIDWNQDGQWAGFSKCGDEQTWEHVLMNLVVPNGYMGPLSGLTRDSFLIGPEPGYVWARFTISDNPAPAVPWGGRANFDEGETEDYLLEVLVPLDFGDAPEAESCQYPTTLAYNGARHAIVSGPNQPTGIYLGNGVDPDRDGQPNAKATGDDEDIDDYYLPWDFDDEDGVVFTSALVLGETATVDVNANVRGFLNAWVDFDADGDWLDAGDQIFASEPLDAGINSLTFQVPVTAAPNVRTYARFRFSTTGELPPFGPAPNGEVEDYAVYLVKPPVEHLKWSQPPIEWMPTGRTPVYCGWDEPALRGALELSGPPVRWYMVADDFRCLGSMPITSVHWWGSHLDWHEPNLPDSAPEAFHLAIWTNVAASDDPCVPLSHPGRLIWENRCDDYEWNFAGYDRFGQLIADNPTISIGPNSVTGPIPGPGDEAEFNWLDWRGWWVRGQSTRIEFTFTGIDTAAIPGDQFLVKLNLGVTNEIKGYGHKGLDGLAIVEIGGPGGPPYNLSDVLLDNLDPNNHIYPSDHPSGTYETTASMLVDKKYIRDGTLTIVVYRNNQGQAYLPNVPVCSEQPIDMSGPLPVVPKDCYVANDAHSVNIHIKTTDDTGEVAASGEVTLWVPGYEIENAPVAPSGVRSAKAITETCFQYYVQLHPDEYFWQENYIDETDDNIFWLSITALCPDSPRPPDYPWGWKTRPWHWMDDAVIFELEPDNLKPGLAPDPKTIIPIANEQVCEEMESYDMAFELDTDLNYIKWEQPYDSVHHWLHHEPELSTVTKARADTIVESAIKWTQKPDMTNGMGVNATNNQEFEPVMGGQIAADDFACKTTGPLTNITIWGSWCRSWAVPDLGILPFPQGKPDNVRFTLSIHQDTPAPPSPRPANVPANPHFSRPGKVLWTRQFGPDEFAIEQTGDAKAYYSPGITSILFPGVGPAVIESIYKAWDFTKVPIYRYSFHVDPGEAFIQQGRANNQLVYWLSVQATPLDKVNPGDPVARFGWMTTPVENHWNDNAVWVWGVGPPPTGVWMGPLQYPREHAQIVFDATLEGKPIDLAFEITGQKRKNRMVADDWQCERKTPVTAAVWWGSYIGYGYEACHCQNIAPPVKPDYFQLSIWTDVPDPNPSDPATYSRPGEKIWQYKAYDYDEVLAGYDKYPHQEPNEPVFRYSIRLPKQKWFCQEDVNDIYWFSVAAVYEGPNEPPYAWGWTNHKHGFNDDAVTGYLDAGGPVSLWRWEELHDQTGRSEDMSFILFTEPYGPIADLNCDMIVNYLDLDIVTNEWLTSAAELEADLNKDGEVDFEDYAELADAWLSEQL